ncbi:hypothetical protein QBC43DRAFT_302142 [Cladorrhinum sp. PSN259]|nr:hypothetical protein QBC43DRAFT_302142 [Cladorrhinum sp. PSN259]
MKAVIYLTLASLTLASRAPVINQEQQHHHQQPLLVSSSSSETISVNHHPHSLPKPQPLPSLREQAKIQDEWTAARMSNIPNILKKYNVDAWLISQKEYAEDTTFWSLKSSTEFSARRRTTILFLAHNLTHPVIKYVDNTPSLWPALNKILKEQQHSLKRIAVNNHPEIAFASGLHAGEYDLVKTGLSDSVKTKLVTEPMVAVEYVATMPSCHSRKGWYKRLQETAWSVIHEAFSESVIEPGKTTTEDVEWWMRERLQELKYGTWFQPSVTIVDEKGFFGPDDNKNVIQYGDLLHVDFGVTALGMNTDTQHLGYVLRPGEKDVPEGLREGLKKGNKAQDIVKGNMKIGKTGNEILKKSLDDMKKAGIRGRVYSHPIGDWGHSAGTLIGMTNLQDGVPVLGDIPLLPHMYYSVELMVEHFVPERNVTLQFPLEEDIVHFGGNEWEWAYGRQERFHVVRSKGSRDDEL